MEAVVALLGLGFVALIVVGPVIALVVWNRTSRLERRIDELSRQIADMGRPPERARAAPVPSVPATVAPEAAAVPPSRLPAAAPTAAPRPPAEAPPAAGPPAAATRPSVPRPPVPPRATPAAPPIDFATNLGPKILVATGALAFMVFLGLFAKYAWDNNWVGPAGRVLIGAMMGLGLLTLGIRLMGREYRPLGQGLSSAGLAGLYISAFAAHGLYYLVPREVSALLMVAVTVAAVMLAVRLDARLLGALAWTGGYMTPLLLSTGQDRPVALFLFLLILAAGALVIDHLKPWPETAPLAMAGTVLLYSGWYAKYFRPERFDVAAAGLVVLTGVFAFGMARKQRSAGLGAVIAVAGIGVSAMAGSVDRPVPLLVLSLLLGAPALLASTKIGGPAPRTGPSGPRTAMGSRVPLTGGTILTAVALVAVALPFAVWGLSHYRADAFGIAALWVIAATALFLLPARLGTHDDDAGPGMELSVLAGAGLASASLCAATDRPLEIAAFLAAMAGLAVVLRGRWREAEILGIVGTALSVGMWTARFFTPQRSGDAYLIALPAAGVFAAALLSRGLLARNRVVGADVAAHVLLAGFTWWFFYSVLDAAHPALKGPVAAAMAAVYLAVGLAARRRIDPDPRLARAGLSLAAGFVTLAIPVQLGLHGVTLGWALEGLVLLALGTRFASDRARAGGYAVLLFAVVRLIAVHLPLHHGDFRPVWNPVFGTWLAVVIALGVALRLTRAPRRELDPLDSTAGWLVAGLGLVLLFGLLTGETRATFDQRQLAADRAGDALASQAARRVGGLSVSVLWTVFATSLLAAGLAARSRALFYAAYGLFAVTAGKVIFWDLGSFSLPYRMAAFLALGLLLMAGAYLNLRFRQRLMPSPAS
jgi:uncharacterized membrane protein